MHNKWIVFLSITDCALFTTGDRFHAEYRKEEYPGPWTGLVKSDHLSTQSIPDQSGSGPSPDHPQRITDWGIPHLYPDPGSGVCSESSQPFIDVCN